jgi:very-short-patch-repair endonuclease
MQVEAWHAAAILAGGDSACLCAQSAGWWAKVWPNRPQEIHVAVRHRHEHVPGIRWHRLRLRHDEIERFRRMPITTLTRIPLDLAADLSLWELKGVLAELEFHHGIGPDQLTLRRGCPGSKKLRRAIAEHTPELALTRSHLEKAFAAFLSDHGFALPAFNHPVGKSTVDAVFDAQGVVVELDGVAGHSGERRVLRDHRRDLLRRADGLVALRYHHAQLIDPADGRLIEAELERFGVPRRR